MAVGLLLLASVLGGCASQAGRDVIIDRQGVDMNRYERDLAECTTYAAEVRSGEKVAGSAAGGAVVGGAVGAVTGGGDGARQGAGVGGIIGGARGGQDAWREQQRVVKTCLRGRGYRVLN